MRFHFIKITVIAYMIPDPILQAINDYTYGLIIFGLESGSNKILKKLHKGITVEQIKETVTRIKEFGGRKRR